jgi:methyl-accepting chemotaxis protein
MLLFSLLFPLLNDLSMVNRFIRQFKLVFRIFMIDNNCLIGVSGFPPKSMRERFRMGWLKNLKVTKKLFLLIFIAVTASIAIGLTGFYYLMIIEKGSEEMYNDRLLPVKWLNENRAYDRGMEVALLEMLLNKDDVRVKILAQEIEEQMGKFQQNLTLYEKIKLDPFEVDNLKMLKGNLDAYLGMRKTVMDLALQNKNDEAYKLYVRFVRQTSVNLNNNLIDLADYNTKAASEIDAKHDALAERASIVFSLIIGGSIIILLVFGKIISKSITHPLKEAVEHLDEMAKGNFAKEVPPERLIPRDEMGDLARGFNAMNKSIRTLVGQISSTSELMASSAEELASTSSNLSDAAQTQAASIEEASASLEEVSASGELINKNARDQASLAEETYKSMKDLKGDNEMVVGFAGEAFTTAQNSTQQANVGQQLMGNTIIGMNTIDESTKKIADTVRLISDVSDQVNLLALNASIEAARAGEHGRGFAVVAEEISKLADETASSAKSIAELVRKGLIEVGKGREYVDATSAAFNNILSYISQTGDLVKKITDSAEKQSKSSVLVLTDTQKVMEMSTQISSSTHEQMITNNEMSKTIDQINQKTQLTAASAEEIASSAEQISVQAETLRNQISFFKV